MDVFTLLMISTGVLAVILVLLIIIVILTPQRPVVRREYINAEDELDSIRHQVELEGEKEAEEELMPYKPPRLDSPKNRKRL